MNATDAVPARIRWADIWLDGVAFALGLIVAWRQGWNTTDLVWSLWLSSLVVGFAIIVWSVTAPLRGVMGELFVDPAGREASAGGKVLAIGVIGAGTLVGLVFFTLHFGAFHVGHSVFLNSFFPIAPGGPRHQMWPGLPVYLEVARRYWWFLPAAAIAERAAFRPAPADADTAVTAEAIARRKGFGNPMSEPYKNVARMHLLIFFFFFAHFVRLESFYVYAVVYAVYFFPWRVLKRNPAAIVTA